MKIEQSLQSLWEDFLIAKGDFEDKLLNLIGDYESIGHDPYDNSLEICEVPNDVRLNEEAQRLIWDAGFRKIYVNHIDMWQTHYNWKNFVDSFKVVRGWRRKSKEDQTGFLISYWPETWTKKEWLETGYMVIVPDELELKLES